MKPWLRLFFPGVLMVALTVPAARGATTTINPSQTFQTMVGFGGATAFYTSWVTAHPYKQEIYTNAFAGLNISMLRLGDWYRYQTPLAGFDAPGTEIVSNANRVLGHSVPVYMSSWAPPAFLKSNGQTANGGTLLYTNGGFAYTNFAQYWYDSINAYQSNGVTMKWISLQNEPDWVATYDSCIFNPTEGVVNGTNYASYTKAMDAVYQRLTNLPSPPLLFAPEPTHAAYNDLQNYGAYMDTNSFYAVAYHLYGGSTDGTADGYSSDLTASSNVFPGKPHIMTEFGYPDLMQTACLIHNCITIGQDSGFNYWSLIWPVGGDGLIIQENPFNLSSWTNAPPGVTTQSHGWWYSPAYWAMKHFSFYIQPGYRRVSATDNDINVRSSAFISPDGTRLVVVLINTNTAVASAMNFNYGTFTAGISSVYQTAGTNTYAGTNTFLSLGSLTNGQVLPPLSVTTVVLNQSVSNVWVGMATNPFPASGAANVALNSLLSWTPGSNALNHAVYLGLSSNSVAQDTPNSSDYQGIFSTTNFSPSLGGNTTYFWRVDEVGSINTNTGAVWSFSTVAASTNFSLINNDGFGNASFNSIGNWVTSGTTNAATSPPGPSGAYNTTTYTLRTPTTGNATFGGGPLTLSAGAPLADGSLLLKGPNGAVITVNNLILSGGVLAQGVNSGASGIEWITGNINVVSNSYISGLGTAARYIGVAANINGSASLSNDCNVIYSGNNTGFTGQWFVGSGGTVQISNSMNLGGAKLVLDNGTFQPTASLAMNNSNGTLILSPGGGTLQIGSGLTLTISNTIIGAGNLLGNGGGTLQIAGANSATGNLMASNLTLVLLGNATLKNSQLGISNNATLDLTALAVPLNISNHITLGGNLAVTVNKTNFTSLLMANNISYRGTLTLSNLGPPLVYGDTISLFSASNYSGAFGSIIPTTPGTDLLWNTNWISVNGTLFVTSTNPVLMTPLRVSAFNLSGGNIVVSGTNGNAPGTVFFTLASTNLALPLTNWTVVATNQFGAGGGFKITNNYDARQAGQFFIWRLP